MLVVTSFAIGVACTFPDVTFATAEGGTSETGTPEANTPIEEAGIDDRGAIVITDGQGGSAIDAKACEAGLPHCDCDKDTYGDQFCDVDASTLGLKLGDCDDLNDSRNPGIQNYSSVPTDAGNWNCINGVEKAYSEVPSDWCKATLLSSGVIGCTTARGFDRTVGCGEYADFFKCVTNGLGGCKTEIDNPNMRQAQQACR
jgi:hypothetical protein